MKPDFETAKKQLTETKAFLDTLPEHFEKQAALIEELIDKAELTEAEEQKYQVEIDALNAQGIDLQNLIAGVHASALVADDKDGTPRPIDPQIPKVVAPDGVFPEPDPVVFTEPAVPAKGEYTMDQDPNLPVAQEPGPVVDPNPLPDPGPPVDDGTARS